MNVPRLLILADGKHELGAADEVLEAQNLPALPCLVHRLLDRPEHIDYLPRPFHLVGHTRGIGTGYKKKVLAAALEARKAGYMGVIVLIDRDRKPAKETLLPLQQGRDAAAERGLPVVAVGVAVETFDAWMIADGKAIGQAGGNDARSHPHPEKLTGEENSGNHPKDKAHELFPGGALSEKYRLVARHLRLDVLERCCPEGFKPFADEVRERILPLLTPTGKS